MPTGAFNYRVAAWHTGNISALQKRVGILLGLDVLETRSLSSVFAEAGLELVSEERFEWLGAGADGTDLNDSQGAIRQRFREIPLERPDNNGTSESLVRLFEEIIYLKNKVVSSSILKNGIHLGRYRVGSSDGVDSIKLIYRTNEGESWRILAAYSSEQEAVTAANGLRRFLIGLNVASEGLHILEHILLRPLAAEFHTEITVPADYYSFKLSVVFPAWTARFSDPAFRRVAVEAVEQNCPAHVYPEFHWLDFEPMEQFERLYKNWLDLKCGETTGPEQIDRASKQLISFILEIQDQRHGGDKEQS